MSATIGHVLQAAHLPWTEVRDLASRGALALLPVGSTEAHGPHLPLSVDVVIAEAVCRRAAQLLSDKGTTAVLFPPVSYGLTDFAAAFSGTVSVSADVTTRYLAEVMAGIAGHGFVRVGVVNHHVEPAHFRVVHEAAKQAAAKSGSSIIVPDHRRKPFVEKLGPEFVSGGSHAGLYETSLMMAAAPGLVREEARVRLPDLDVDLPGAIKAGAKDFHACGGPDAYFGAPARASAEEGHRLLELLAELVVEQLAPGPG